MWFLGISRRNVLYCVFCVLTAEKDDKHLPYFKHDVLTKTSLVTALLCLHNCIGIFILHRMTIFQPSCCILSVKSPQSNSIQRSRHLRSPSSAIFVSFNYRCPRFEPAIRKLGHVIGQQHKISQSKARIRRSLCFPAKFEISGEERKHFCSSSWISKTKFIFLKRK